MDDDPHLLAAAERLARGQEWSFTSAGSLGQARELLQRESFAVLITDQRLLDGMGTELLAEAQNHWPAMTRVLLSGLMSVETLYEAVNQCHVFRILAKPWEEDILREAIADSILHHARRVDQKTLLRQINQQNRELEELSFGLKKRVNARTETIERKKSEAESNLAKLRELVRFINSLSEVSSVEELFLLARREFRRYAGVTEPVLVYTGFDHRQRIIYSSGGEVIEKEAEQSWASLADPASEAVDDRQLLANELGRPLAQLVRFSLAIPRRFRDPLSMSTNPFLFIEHILGGGQSETLRQSVDSLLQPLSIAFDRIVVERQMQRTALQWATTFGAIQDPIAIVGADHRVLRANRQFLRLNTAGPLNQRKCHSAYFGTEEPCANCPVPEATAKGVPTTSNLKVGERDYEVSSYPIVFNPHQKATSVVNHYVDITDSRGLYIRLIQNEKMAALGLLAGNIAHELNNPLTGIRNLAQLVLSDVPKEAPIHGDLQEVEKAAARCQKVIRDLLDFSSEQTHLLQRVQLSEVVKKTLPLLKTALRNFYQEIELVDEGDWVEVEPQLLQQVVFNLLNNACQAMGEAGTLTVTSDILQAAEGKNWVRLRVRDSGPGIPPALHEKIFEPFFTTKALGEGTGLGLSICRSIIERYGGQLTVDSEPPHGAEFTLLLERVAAPSKG